MRYAILLLCTTTLFGAAPRMEKEDIFPLDSKHNHASSIVRLPNGDLFVCWYRGSGERESDDVQVMAARKRKGAKAWSQPFLLADAPGFPDTNPTLFLDSKQRLWLYWQTIIANRWETALTHYRIASKYDGDGPPQWDVSEVLLLKPRNFTERVRAAVGQFPHDDDKYFMRMGWMGRAHPTELPSGRILLPLYSDGYSFSLIAITDDGGKTFQASEPIVGYGNIQPSIARRKDGTLVAYMRDNGPAPKRVQWSESKDDGVSWSPAKDTGIPNSGTGLEVLVLKDGRWLMINNDTDRGRHSLALSLSDDEGLTWSKTRHVELDQRGQGAGSFHYPSIVQAPDGSVHASYSVFLNHVPEGQPRKTIRHAHFDLAWVEQGDPR